jgi:glycine/serine hydroxymethyltransferase
MPAMTTRGIKEKETKTIADFIHRALQHQKDSDYLKKLHQEVKKYCIQYPIPS